MASTCELLGGADGKVTTEILISVEKRPPTYSHSYVFLKASSKTSDDYIS